MGKDSDKGTEAVLLTNSNAAHSSEAWATRIMLQPLWGSTINEVAAKRLDPALETPGKTLRVVRVRQSGSDVPPLLPRNRGVVRNCSTIQSESVVAQVGR